MKNRKGHVYLLSLVAVPAGFGAQALTIALFKAAFMAILGACIWHIPAWEHAKDTHTEAIYQAQPMWPNTVPNTAITYKLGNGGNFTGGIDK